MTKPTYLRYLLLLAVVIFLVLLPSIGPRPAVSAYDFCSDCFRECRRYTGAMREVCMNGCVAQGCEIP